jgi:amidase
MALPVSRSRSGLPVSVQLVARFGDEAAIFSLASQLEAAKG